MVLDSGGFSNAFTCGIRQGGAFELKQATWAYNHALESAGGAGRSAAEGGHRGRGPARLVRRACPGAEAARRCAGSGLRGLPARPVAARHLRRLLEAGRHLGGGLLRRASRRCRSCSCRAGTTPMCRPRWKTMPALKADRPVALIMGPWTARQPLGAGVRRCRFRPGGDLRRPGRPRLAELSAALVRPLAEGGDRRRRSGRPGALLPDGRRIGAQDAAGPSRPRRRLASGPRLAGARRPAAGAAPAPRHGAGRGSRRRPRRAMAWDFDPRDPVPTIGGSLTSGEPIFTGGGFDQVEAERLLRLPQARPAADGAARRAVVRDRAAGRGSARWPAR